MAVIHYSAQQASSGLSAADLGLEFISLRRLEFTGSATQALGKPTSRQVETAESEICLVVLSGQVEYSCSLPPDGQSRAGTAAEMDMLLLPPHSRATLVSAGGVVMSYESPSELGADFQHVRFTAVDANPATHHVYGKSEIGSRRHVWNFIDSQQRCTRLMMGICEGDPGGWTAWPPHEHSAEREEVYVYFDMGHSFGIQCVYESLSEIGAAVIVRDGDVVSIPHGYHPNTGCPGGRIKYVYCMAAKIPGVRDFMDLRIQKEFGDRFV